MDWLIPTWRYAGGWGRGKTTSKASRGWWKKLFRPNWPLRSASQSNRLQQQPSANCSLVVCLHQERSSSTLAAFQSSFYSCYSSVVFISMLQHMNKFLSVVSPANIWGRKKLKKNKNKKKTKNFWTRSILDGPAEISFWYVEGLSMPSTGSSCFSYIFPFFSYTFPLFSCIFPFFSYIFPFFSHIYWSRTSKLPKNAYRQAKYKIL